MSGCVLHATRAKRGLGKLSSKLGVRVGHPGGKTIGSPRAKASSRQEPRRGHASHNHQHNLSLLAMMNSRFVARLATRLGCADVCLPQACHLPSITGSVSAIWERDRKAADRCQKFEISPARASIQDHMNFLIRSTKRPIFLAFGESLSGPQEIQGFLLSNSSITPYGSVPGYNTQLKI